MGPIGNGNKAPDSQLSWILANICQKAADSCNSKEECTSTEDMLSAIDKCNQNYRKAHNQVMISLDVVALYPSLEAEETAEICASMVVSSGLWFDAIDWEEAALYVVLTEGSGSVSMECLPSRKYSTGPKPTITTAEVTGPLIRNKKKSKFNPPVREPTELEKKAILHQLLKTAIKTVMNNHTYKWNDEVRLQSKGGGIGDKLAQAAARLVMIWFDRQLLRALEDAKIEVSLYKRYVDDGNFKLPAIEEGFVWDKNSKSLKKDPSSVTSAEPPDKRTAHIIKDIADSMSGM